MSKLTEYFNKQSEKAIDLLSDFLKDIEVKEKESDIEEKETIKEIEQEEKQIETEEENSKVLEQIQDSIKNYQKIAKYKSFYFYIFTLPIFGYALFLFGNIIL